MRVLVVGAGVAGLTSALELLDAGCAVSLCARERPEATVSARAAAIWYPYLVQPIDAIVPWAKTTFDRFVDLAADSDATGVLMRDGIEIFRHLVEAPVWQRIVPGFRRATAAELASFGGHYIDGFAMRLPVIDMSIYLGWLEQRCAERGARLVERSIDRLEDMRDEADVVVNCTGLGARTVSDDARLFGVRGQIQVVQAPDVSTFVIDDAHDAPTYIIPRSHDVVLGGTEETHVYDTAPSVATAASIRERCVRLMPSLASARPVGDADRVGIRPCRSAVRLEVETLENGTRVVHNYGHGGSGVTLSWGCAREVVRLVRSSSLG
jgi:D-amino-acid oxidase